MARSKRKKRARHRDRRRARRFRRFTSNQIASIVKDSERYETCKANHSDFLQALTNEELDVLNRTVIISHVRDLSVEANKVSLELFLQRKYGIIQEFQTVKPKLIGKQQKVYPIARVTFASSDTAERLMGGIPLESIRKKWSKERPVKTVKRVGCVSVGYSDYIEVNAADQGRSTLSQVARLKTNKNVVSFPVDGLSVGHFYTCDMLDDDPNLGTKSSVLPAEHCLFLEEYAVSESFEVLIDLQERMMIIVGALPGKLHSMMFIKWKIILGGAVLCSDITTSYRNPSLCFRLICPPRVYVATTRDLKRTTSFKDLPVGRCLGYRLLLPNNTARDIARNGGFGEKLRKFGMMNGEIEYNGLLQRVITQKISFAGDDSIGFQFRSIENKRSGLLARAVMDCVSCSYEILKDKVERNGLRFSFFDLINNTRKEIIWKVLSQMKDMHIPVRYPTRTLDFLIQQAKAAIEGDEDLPTVPSYCIEVPRVLVTPTRQKVVGFDIEMGNRVLRYFMEEGGLTSDDFLRLSLGDEQGQILRGFEFSEEIRERFREILTHGLRLNRQHFKFLAYSTSQLKEQSVWMVNCPPLGYWNVKRMREWMGDFSSITIPSKFGARMGQCFSMTVQTSVFGRANEIGGLNARQLTVNDSIEDVTCGEGPWYHSDGTGLIDKSFLRAVIRKVPFSPRDVDDVSIIQIRLGGSKGTLTAWDMSSLRSLTENLSLKNAHKADVYIRPSMIKFKVPYRHLEVVSLGAHIPYHLNRQMAMLLDVHGVPRSILLKLQKDMLNKLDSVLVGARQVTMHLPSFLGNNSSTDDALIYMASAGISPKEDPYLFSCIHAIRSHYILNLQKKTRIRVEKGAVLMGGLDETGLVPQHCVFLNVRPSRRAWTEFSGQPAEGFEVITGPVMVAKHPVTHPGDLRMLLAVDVPELRGHRNVLLFSQHGARPEADKMAGSDLDGDQFAVTWDSRLFLGYFNRVNGEKVNCLCAEQVAAVNFPPMGFEEKIGPAHVEKVTDSDLINHFLNHATSDSLGTISMLWLDWAAIMERADCNQCLKLAELHSVAVDFSKTGVPAVIPRELYLSGKARPHWRELKKGTSFHCESIVGQLYDAVISAERKGKGFHTYRSAAGRVFSRKGQLLCYLQSHSKRAIYDIYKKVYDCSIPHRLNLFQPLENHSNHSEALQCLEWAAALRREYERTLLEIMNKYKIYSEGELMTGCIRKYHRLDKRRQHAFAQEVRNQYQELRSAARREFFREAYMKYLEAAESEHGETKTQGNETSAKDAHGHGDDQSDTQELQITTLIEDKMIYKVIDREHYEDYPVEVIEYVESLDMVKLTDYAQKLAAACYVVTYNPQLRSFEHNDEKADTGNPVGQEDVDEIIETFCALVVSLEESLDETDEFDSVVLFSFPWIFADVIAIGLLKSSLKS